MGYPTDRRYLASHEWHKLDGDICTIGITKFAADELTDITYVDLPSPGKEVAAGKPFGARICTGSGPLLRRPSENPFRPPA